MPQKDLHEANRVSWNTATEAHNSHKRDQAAFFGTAAAHCTRRKSNCSAI